MSEKTPHTHTHKINLREYIFYGSAIVLGIAISGFVYEKINQYRQEQQVWNEPLDDNLNIELYNVQDLTDELSEDNEDIIENQDQMSELSDNNDIPPGKQEN